MESVLLKSNSTSDIELILTLAKKLGIEIQKIDESRDNPISIDSKNSDMKHNFFNSKGLWKNRNIEAKTLRNEAWRIQQ